jgi:hypothetical protein
MSFFVEVLRALHNKLRDNLGVNRKLGIRPQ